MKHFSRCRQLHSQLHSSILFKRTFFPLVVFILSAFLSACVTVEKHTLPPGSEINKQAAWEVHRANIQALHTWKLKGRVAGKSKDEGFRAGVHWNQLPTQYIIDLHGPLGRKVAVITGTQASVQLKTSKGESYEAQNAEALMQELFGYSLPVKGLQFWLLGIPDPNTAQQAIELDQQGRLKMLKQAGWVIEYKRYHDRDLDLPGLIYLSNATLSANIKIDHWAVNGNE